MEICAENASVGDTSFADNRNSFETVGNESKGDQVNVGSEGEVITSESRNDSEICRENVSVGDTSYADDRKSIETVGNESKFDQVNVGSEGEVTTQENSNESEISGKNVSVGDNSYADNRNSIETVGNESKCDQVNIGSEGEVTTQENSNDSEICGENVSVGDTSYADDRKSIETFGNESKVDQVNVLSASQVVTPLNSEKEEVKSSDVNSSDDDDDVPLSKLKMLSSMGHEIVNNKNTVSFTSYAKSTGIKSNGEYDGSTIERINERLNDNEEKDNKPMSMEEYRLAYASKFFEAAVNDEETITKKTKNREMRWIVKFILTLTLQLLQ